MAQKVVRTLPSIKAKIGHIHQKLKTGNIDEQYGRLEILRRIVTRLVREERIELPYNRAEEARPYMERLIQLGVYYGKNDPYTAEMMDFWLIEKDLETKMFNVLIPRFRDGEHAVEPYTSLYKLPPLRYQMFKSKSKEFWTKKPIGVLELNGNPFPSVIRRYEDHSQDVFNTLMRECLKDKKKLIEEK
uniref:Large ribosomal subunit protein bL17m n=1 Tax=Strongyloides venezuelensis TaxID=75913 RepID=A0A0K0F511_STRVS